MEAEKMTPAPAATGNGREDERGERLDQNCTTATALLDDVRDALTRFIAWPDEHAADAVTLWIAATHAQPAWHHATRLVISSPEKRCGKTRALEVVRALCHRPLATTNISVAALVRSIDADNPPTLVLDEADTVFGRRRDKPEAAEDLRGILNSGHSRGWPYLRWDHKAREVEECATFAMALLAGIGDLPDTIRDRAIEIPMRRRAPHERVASFRRHEAAELSDLRQTLHEWIGERLAELERLADSTSLGVPADDRAADVWEPMVAVAFCAGTDWTHRARAACRHYTAAAPADELSLGERLLADLRDIWPGEDDAFTDELLARLHKIEEAPWCDWHGRELTARDLSRLLRPYKIRPTNVRRHDRQAKGYRHAETLDAWSRYLAVPSVPASQHGETPDSAQPGGGTVSRQASVPDASQAISVDEGSVGEWDGGTDGTAGVPTEAGDVCPACSGEGCHWCSDTGHRIGGSA